jgi:hypothetical protein
MFTKSGERIAIVGNLEKDAVERMGVFETVLGYDEGIRGILLETLQRLNPDELAVNTSPTTSTLTG